MATTDSGYVNKRGQVNLGPADPPRAGNLPGQKVYVMHCPEGHNYGANGCDIHERKCPIHQDGKAGLPLQRDEPDWRP